jgi:hypothetical protein
MADNPNPTTPTTPTGTPPANGGNQSSGQSPQGDPPWLPDRLERAKAAERTELLKALGFEKVEDIKALLVEAKQLKDAQLTGAEKTEQARKDAEAAAAKLKADLDAANEKLSAVETKRRSALVDGKIAALADKANAEHAEDVVNWAHLNLKPEELAKLIGEGDKLDEAEIGKIIEKVKVERPSWFKVRGPGSPSNSGGRTPQPSDKDKERAAAEQYKNLRTRF